MLNLAKWLPNLINLW